MASVAFQHSGPRQPAARGHIDVYAGYYSEPAPTGIADYGILNASGTVTAYTEEATAVTGTAVIDSMQSTVSNPPQGSSPYGAGLQLNVVMQVNTTASSYDYWLQNTVTFYTNNDTLYYVSNVWNYSSPTASMSTHDTAGLGSISPSGNQSFYGYATNETSYTLPLALDIPINISYSGDAVRTSFSYLQAQGGTPLAGTPSSYDMVTITEPQQVQSAVILVTGKAYTPSYNFFDSELDFGGDANGANATFTAMQAVLNMSYLLTDGHTALPPSVYGFGGDTAEAATNLQTSQVGGQFVVSLGTEDFRESFVPTSNSTSSVSTTSTSTASSAQAASTSVSSTTPVSNTTTYASATSAAGGIPEFPSGGLAFALLTVALVGSYFVVRRRMLSAGPPRAEGRVN